ncbi:MAG: tyrosine-type recombinase/integrase [Gammaproteobacteria bacterium]
MDTMGRQKLHNKHLPPRMVFRHGAYYHTPRIDGRQRMVRLSADFSEAINLYYQREQRTIVGTTVNDALSRYEREVLPGKAAETQRHYRGYIGRLREVFGDSHLSSVRTSHVAQYLDRRSAKISGNGEIACLSSVFKSAIRWGWCDDNPCRGAPRNPKGRRYRLPSDAELAAIRVAASEQLRCMVDLVLLIGLRKGDLLKIRLPDLKAQGLRVEIEKVPGAVAVFKWSEGLREVIDRARSLRRRVGSLYLFATRRGQRYGTSGFDSIWRRTLKRARVEGLTFHDLRRWAINQAQRQGGLDYAQAIGVHQSRQSTEGYLVPGEVVVRPLR